MRLCRDHRHRAEQDRHRPLGERPRHRRRGLPATTAGSSPSSPTWLKADRRADDLSPPHGHGGRDRARDRPFDGQHRRLRSASCSTAATSPSPAATSLATTRRHGAPHQPRPLQGHPRGRAQPAAKAESWSFLRRCSRASSRFPATASSTFRLRPNPGGDRLRGLGRRRGRAGSGQGAAARIRPHGPPPPDQRLRGSRLQDRRMKSEISRRGCPSPGRGGLLLLASQRRA